MKISPPALIVTLGTVMIVGAFVFFGKKSPKPLVDEPKTPVPIQPTEASPDDDTPLLGYAYRGFFIELATSGEGGWQWQVFTTNDFTKTPIAIGNAATDLSLTSASEHDALLKAVAWVDSFRG